LTEGALNNNLKIIKTKFFRPNLPYDYIPRSHLIEVLEKNINKPIILISASTGFGKSSLVADFLSKQNENSAWLSLSEKENENPEFIKYFITAIQGCVENFGEEVLELVNATSPPTMDELAEMLVNELAEFDENLYLAVDDYHLIKNKDIHNFISKLFEYQQPFFKLIIITRRDPELPLTEWKTHNKLVELRSADLKFNRDEIVEFFKKSVSYNPDDKILNKLLEASDGWITGLRMFTLSTNNMEDLQEQFLNFDFKNVRVIQQLVEAVLKNQPEDIREKLLKLSILREFNSGLFAELCLTGNEKESKGKLFSDFISSVTRSNMFIIALDEDNTNYRFHHLFTNKIYEILLNEYGSEKVDELRIKAAEWYISKKQPDSAIEYYLAANNFDKAIEVFFEYRLFLISTSKFFKLDTVFKLFPQDLIEKKAVLMITQAWLYFYHGNFPPMIELLDPLENLIKKEKLSKNDHDLLLGETYSLKTLDLYELHIDLDACITISQKAISLLKGRNPYAVGMAWIFHCGALQLKDQSKEAKQQLYLEIEKCTDATLKYQLLLSLCVIEWFDGNLKELIKTANFYIDHGKEGHHNASFSSGNGFLGLAYYYQYDNEKAELYLGKSFELRHYPILPLSFPIAAMYASVLAEIGNREENEKIIEICEKWAFQIGGKRHKKHLEATIADSNWSLYRDNASLHWAKNNDFTEFLPLSTLLIPEIIQAKILAMDENKSSWNLSLKILKQMIPFLEKRHNINFLIRAYAIKACALHKLGKYDDSQSALQSALELSEPRNFIRPYIELGKPMQQMLSRYYKTNQKTAHTDKILSYSSKEKEVADKLILSGREIEILVLSEKMTNKEVGGQLFIAEKTVKSHITNINKKLNVKSKIEAIAKARSMELV